MSSHAFGELHGDPGCKATTNSLAEMRKIPVKRQAGNSHPEIYEDSDTAVEPGLITQITPSLETKHRRGTVLL